MIGRLRAEEFDPNSVTPGVIGFVITFVVALAVVFLVLDMTKRVRRVRYRTEISERLDREAAATATDGPADDGGAPRPLRDDLSPPDR